MASIHEPLTIKSVTIPNRIGMPPMCMYSAIDGLANDWHYIHYGTRAVGGCGLIIVEATAVVPEGRITPYDLGIWSDDHIEGLRKITSFIHENGSVAGIQIAHAGRKASHDNPANGGKQLNLTNGGWQTVAPSPIPFDPSERVPAALNQEGIQQVINSFRDAARRAREAGFCVLEIHAAHGYLLHEFLSPLSNTRTDQYGGSFKNRIRLLLEVLEAVKTVWPKDLPLLVRLSATDWAEGGWNTEETVALCSILKTVGVDMIDCSTGGNVLGATIPLEAGYQVPFSEAVRKTGILTATVGLITEINQIEEILSHEKADMVLLGRELLRNPYFPLKATQHSKNPLQWPLQYLRGK